VDSGPIFAKIFRQRRALLTLEGFVFEFEGTTEAEDKKISERGSRNNASNWIKAYKGRIKTAKGWIFKGCYDGVNLMELAELKRLHGTNICGNFLCICV
jgi:hypothetical protein